MLVVTRYVGETFMIGGHISITVLEIKEEQVSLSVKVNDQAEVHHFGIFKPEYQSKKGSRKKKN